ncbi:MAG: hypothetical protein CRN43_09800 [Candidatus Nephrothrix sp. EaCA]|nr:MAG: hypothetical protein CRN43_09800 [Candidatus Nephrothrix sp. EaCA]
MPVYIKKTYASEIFFMFHRTFLTLCAKRLADAAAISGIADAATVCVGGRPGRFFAKLRSASDGAETPMPGGKMISFFFMLFWGVMGFKN